MITPSAPPVVISSPPAMQMQQPVPNKPPKPPKRPAPEASVAPAERGAQVTEIAYTGDVQDAEQLGRLATVHVGQALDPAGVRESLALFYETGLYSSIRVTTEPASQGVRLVFDFKRQKLITAWRFVNAKHIDNNQLARAIELQWGQAWNPAQYPGWVQAIHDRYQREGYPNASATFSTEHEKNGQLTLVVTVGEGAPVDLKAVEVPHASAKDAQDVLKALGLKTGNVLRREELLAGMDKVDELLSQRGLLNSRVGYVFKLPDGKEATSYDDMMALKPASVTLVVSLETGQQALVKVTGHPLLPLGDLGKAVTIYQNRSYSPTELDASAENLRKLYVANGYADTVVTHDFERLPSGVYAITFHVEPGKKVTLKAINFVGNQAFPPAVLLGQMSTEKAGLLGGGIFDPDAWANDLENLKAFYAAQGFPNMDVALVDRSLDKTETQLTLTVHIAEGDHRVVAKLRVLGVTPAQSGGILQALPFNPGDSFNPNKLSELISSVQAYFARSGYPLAHVKAEYQPQPAVGGRIPGILVFTVQPGPRKRIGRVVLRGNVKTKDWVVRRELTVESGQDYNAEELFKTQQRIYQLGFFDRVDVAPMAPPSMNASDPVDIVVALHEREAGWVSFGAGYDSIGDLPGPDLSAEFVQGNLFGMGYPLRLETEVAPQKKDAIFSLHNPYLWGTGLVGELGLAVQDTFQTPTFEILTYGPSIGLTRQLSQPLLGNLRYSWTHVTYLNYVASDLASEGGLLDRVDSVVTAGVTYDTRADLLNPRWGTKADANIDVATSLLGTTLPYTRPRLDAATYIPLPKKWVLALGAEVDYISTLAGYSLIPNDVRFLAGGANSLRGYDYNTVGVPNPGNPACVPGGDPIYCVTGGTVMGLGHVELRFPVWAALGGVVFSDFGNVWATPADVFDGFADFKVTAGLGVRYLTPLGPVRVDYGFKVRPTIDFERNFYFGLGQAF